MNAPKLGGMLKNPVVLIAGLVVGLLILYAVSRSKGGSGAADMTAQSMSISAATSTQLAGYTTDYNKAALSYQLGLAQTAAENHATDVNASTAVELQSLSMIDNIAKVAGQMGLIHEQGVRSLALQSGNNDAMLKSQAASNNLMITLAPHAEALAQIGVNGETARARINADAATTIANINSATQLSVANRQLAGQATKGIFDNLPFIKSLFSSGDSGGSSDVQDAGSVAGLLASFA